VVIEKPWVLYFSASKSGDRHRTVKFLAAADLQQVNATWTAVSTGRYWRIIL